MKITVNNVHVPEQFYQRELSSVRRSAQGAGEDSVRQAAVTRAVDRFLLQQEANRRITDVSSRDVQVELERLKQRYGGEEQFRRYFGASAKDESNVRSEIRQSLKIDRFVDLLCKDVPETPEERLREYFDRNMDDYVHPEAVHALHIVRRATPATASMVQREMNAIRRELLDGGDFATVAQRHSECDDEGGDLGFVSRGKMVEEFEVVVFSLNVGEISPIFKTPFGYHIATVTEKRPETPMTYEEARDEIRTTLRSQVRGEKLREWSATARAAATVQVGD